MGSFGDRFAKIAEVYGAAVTRLEVEWGEAAHGRRRPCEPRPAIPGLQGGAADAQRDVDRRDQRHRRRSRRRRARPRPDALILVDAISALGAVPFAMDAWGLDLVVTGSQKAWMAAPGMAMAAVGPRAWAAGETARMPRFYLDLKRHRDTAAAGETPWTPAVAVMYQVDEGLRLMQAEGDGVFARHAACQAMTRAGLRAIGFELLAADAVASKHGDRGTHPRRPRLVGVQQGAQGARPRPGGRPGQAQGQDLPARPPRLGDDGRDPGRDRRDRGGRRRAGARRASRARRSLPRSARWSRQRRGVAVPA